MTAATVQHPLVEGAPTGDPVVFVNSLGSTLSIWDEQVRAVGGGCRTIRYDLPGHGGEPSRPGRYTMAGLAADLRDVLDAAGVERACVAGVSIGGMIAMQLALDEPSRVSSLVLINASARLTPSSAWEARAEQVLAQGMDEVAERVTRRWVTPEYAAAHPDRLEELRAMMAGVDPVGYAGCCWAIAALDLHPLLHRIAAPTLVVTADEDEAIPPSHGSELARAIPGAVLATIGRAAHVPTVEQPEAVSSAILDHLHILKQEAHP